MSLESLGVIIAFLTGIGAVIVSIRTSLNSVSQKELMAVHKENERLRDQIDKLEKRLANRDTLIEQLKADFSARIDERDETIETLKGQMESLEHQMREVQQENELLRGEVERYRQKDGSKP